MARRLYREWFVRFRFPGYEGVRMVESAVGLVPEGWEVKTVGDVSLELRFKAHSSLSPKSMERGECRATIRTMAQRRSSKGF